MSKSKIGFEIDQADLASAKAFVARNGGSLNGLVSALFRSLGEEERAASPLRNPATRTLLQVSQGKTSLMDAVDELGVSDAGHVLRMMSDAGLPVASISKRDARLQMEAASSALDACLVDPQADKPQGGRRRAKAG